jgi:hypothetical protein
MERQGELRELEVGGMTVVKVEVKEHWNRPASLISHARGHGASIFASTRTPGHIQEYELWGKAGMHTT